MQRNVQVKLKLLTFAVVFITLFFTCDRVAAQYPGTNTRGRVLTVDMYGNQVPLVSGKVDLFFFQPAMPPGQQWILIATTYTDVYGFYYFKGIVPNVYTISINQVKSYNVSIVFIDYRYYAFQDLPQLYF